MLYMSSATSLQTNGYTYYVVYLHCTSYTCYKSAAISSLREKKATLITQCSDKLVEGKLPGVSQNHASEKKYNNSV